ncbi:MAG TPA: 3-phosphoshikimate 1-carboxyvinyltransferase, partial [Candidatus Limiplasma sp.]|nr:3-phosphoshikimate 1-carboxyvinyltransferase [Candidatus Limiplasma sp.]
GEVNADIRATVSCLQDLGARIAYDDGMFFVVPFAYPISKAPCVLDAGESGSTLRFMLPVACALGANAAFTMRGRLPQRPLSPLYEELAVHGCMLSPQGRSPLSVSGQLTGGTYRIAGNISSQFITGLLLALPLLEADSRIEITGTLESRPYVDLTLQVLCTFSIAIQETATGFAIRGRQRFTAPHTIQVEGDWSNAACWFTLGALQQAPVTVTGLSLGSPQGDKAFLSVLERFGAQVAAFTDHITVSGGKLHGIDIDVSATPDLVPMIAAVALKADGETRIQNAARLRLKECDRLQAIANTLGTFGAQVDETDDGLVIHGGQALHGGTVSSQNDHRIAMMAAVVSAVCKGDITIAQADAVNKSYPRFFDDFRLLGGTAREVQP